MNRQEAAQKARTKRLKDFYNLTPEQDDALSAFQGNVCAICSRPQKSGKRLATDHCHKTGLIRGKLCSECNRILGKLEHHKWTAAMFYAVINYLLHPPAEKALGKRVYGYPGRCGTKKHRKYLKDMQKLATTLSAINRFKNSAHAGTRK